VCLDRNSSVPAARLQTGKVQDKVQDSLLAPECEGPRVLDLFVQSSSVLLRVPVHKDIMRRGLHWSVVVGPQLCRCRKLGLPRLYPRLLLRRESCLFCTRLQTLCLLVRLAHRAHQVI
jgi:hypothetical protein